MSRDHHPDAGRDPLEDRTRWLEPRERDRQIPEPVQGRPHPFPALDTLEETRSTVLFGRDAYNLRTTDVRLLRTVGTFRVVYADDLRHEFRRLDRDVRTLREQGLLTSTSHLDDSRERREVLALTPAARDLLRAAETGSREFYAGPVKPRELRHDASLYAVYREHVRGLRARGADVEGVHLDYALKHALWSREAEEQSLHERAERLGLPYDVERGVQIPDLQIVVREPDGRLSRANVELVTSHYSRSTNRAKRAAGFHLYTENTQARGRGEDRDLAAQFLAL